MIVAVATENNLVAQHFGRCPGYTIFEIEGGRVAGQKEIANPGHEPGFLPRYLADMGVKCIIAGGMGSRAQALFAEKEIEAYVGIDGPVEKAASDYVQGKLRSGSSSCEHTGGGHSCGRSAKKGMV